MNDTGHQTLFQGLTAFGLALFIFQQFNLDFQNRKRNILYKKQLDTLMEYQTLIFRFTKCLDLLISKKEDFYELFDQFHYKEVFQKYEDFQTSGKIPFVKRIMKRNSSLNEREIDLRMDVLFSLFHFLRMTYSERSPLKFTWDSKIPIYHENEPDSEMTSKEIKDRMIGLLTTIDKIIDDELAIL